LAEKWFRLDGAMDGDAAHLAKQLVNVKRVIDTAIGRICFVISRLLAPFLQEQVLNEQMDREQEDGI